MKRAWILALGLSGCDRCERGCLAAWLETHAAGGGDPHGSPRIELGGTDCEGGLIRCVGGRIEASRAAHIPSDCEDRPGHEAHRCACPWETIDHCRTGCAAPSVEFIATADAAVSHLCATADLVIREALPNEHDVEICATEGVTCRDGAVRACDGLQAPARILGVCLHGCETSVALAPLTSFAPDHGSIGSSASRGDRPGDPPIGDGAASILCRRAPAERR